MPVLSSWAATCSDPTAVSGIWTGPGGGARSLPYRAPVFVLAHRAREPLTMKGGTTFTFVTDGIEAALERARKAAGGRDVAIAGGAATVNQFLAAGRIDELRTHVVPRTLGAGERLFADVPPLNLKILSARSASLVTHITYGIQL